MKTDIITKKTTGATEISSAMFAPLILRNLLTSIFIFFDEPISKFTQKYKLFYFIRHLLITSFVFFLRLLPLCFPPNLPKSESDDLRVPTPDSFRPDHGVSEPGIARALSQLLSIVNGVPVSSRKYEIVRSLAERLIEENHREGMAALREVNRNVLAACFARNIHLLEDLMVGKEISGVGPVEFQVSRILRAVRGRVGRTKVGEFRQGSEISSEKIAAELLWLAEKISAYGNYEESCSQWAAADGLARLALSAEPRLQGILVKISAFMFKQAKEMGKEEAEEMKREANRQTKLKLLLSWLPLLCRASYGTDTPVLSSRERSETERALEETIKTLKPEEQEQVLSVWLHHYTFSHSSDWPNLHASYLSWYAASLKLFNTQ